MNASITRNVTTKAVTKNENLFLFPCVVVFFLVFQKILSLSKPNSTLVDSDTSSLTFMGLDVHQL